MREPYTQLYVHLVWATWDRLPMLDRQLQPRLYACIRAECEKLGAKLIAIGGVADHLHVLVRIPPTLAISTLAKQVKGASSHLVNQVVKPADTFKWQGGYGAFTVSKSAVPTVRAYIQNQEQHHREGTTDKDYELAWEEQAPVPGE